MRNGLITLAAGALLLVAAADAAAQSDAYINLMRTQNQQMMNRVRIYSSVRSGARITRYSGGRKSSGGTTRRPSGGGSGSSGTSRPAPLPAATTTFNPVAPSIMPQQMATEIARTPDERPKLEKMFGDLLENYRDRLRRGGAPLNDVARAASYLIAASNTVYFDTEPLSAAQFNALREHMQEVFGTDDKFRRASDRERQQMFETFGIMGAWTDVGFGVVKQAGDREAMRQWREMARANLENMLGAPPEKLKFTLNGVEYR